MDKAMGKHSINLLQPELHPKKPLWSLKMVVSLWLLTLVIMLAWLFVSQYQLSSLVAQDKVLNTEQKILDAKVTNLEERLRLHKPNKILLDKLALLKLVITNKKILYSQLTDQSRTFVMGFSSAMTELSSMHNENISLQTVRISNDDMAFSGLALSPESVPAWLAGFEKSTLLAGKKFVNFTLQENEQKLTEFVVSSKASTERGK